MKVELEKLLNLPLLEVSAYEIGTHTIDIHCESRSPLGICPHCLQTCTEVTKYYTRKVRDMPVFGKKVYLHIQTRQFHCADCNRYFSESFDFVSDHSRMSHRLESYLYIQCEGSCVHQVSMKEDVAWHTLQSICNTYSSATIAAHQNWDLVKYLGIDEISIKKGKKDYACVIVDLERAVVLDFLACRDKAYLISYFQAKGKRFCEQIEVLSSDMWEGFVNLVPSVFPHAVNVIDRFHLFVHLNKALDAQRKSLRCEHPKEEGFKRLRWPLLKAPETLRKAEEAILAKAFELSPTLAQLYELRNRFRTIFDQANHELEANVSIAFWQQEAMCMQNKYMDKFLGLLHKWRNKILNYFSFPVTNAVVEGINNHIRGIIRRAFGYRKFDNLRNKVLLECARP